MKPILHFVSLFSGIEAFSVAASRIVDVDWRPVFFSEIDPFACAVLAHRFPNVPNLGDITQIEIDHERHIATNGAATAALPRTGIDILAGGSPCQGFSVAGKRLGARDPRSALAFEYARLVRGLRPRVLLWENVPGVLSSNGGRDFGAFLRSLAELGYGLAWRVLDVQHARVDSFPGATPQRRRRVWLVGCLGGDGRVPAQILFERPSLLGDTPPRREAGKGFAAPAGYGPARNDRVVEVARACGNGQLNQSEPEIVAKTLDTMHDAQMVVTSADRSASFDGEDCSATLHKPNGAPGYSDQEVFSQGGVSRKTGDEVVTIAKEAYNAGARQNGALGFGTDGVAACVRADEHPSAIARCLDMTHADEVIREVDGGAAPTLQSRMGTGGNQVPLVLMVSRGDVRDRIAEICAGLDEWPEDEWYGVTPELNLNVYLDSDGKRRATAFLASDERLEFGADIEYVGDGKVGSTVAVGFKPGQSGREDTGSLGAQSEQSPTLPRESERVRLRHVVRRLTPGECETLMAFPQGWTKVPYRGRPADQCPDSPRYKALGNSWGTNCAEWVLRRIVAAFRLGLI